MITIENELQAREEFYNLAYLLLTEEEKRMPKYEALKSVLERCLTREETIKLNPELDCIINAITNEGYTFKQAIVRYLGVDYLNAPDNSELYNEILEAALQRDDAINTALQREIKEQQKQTEQLTKIQDFCKHQNLDVDNFIAEMQEKIAQPMETYSMEEKNLIGYKIAIDVINEIENNCIELPNPTTNKYNIKPFLFTFCGRTYLVNENCGVITLKEFLEPNNALNTYVQLFAEYIQKNKPNSWAEIIKCVDTYKKAENNNDVTLHTIKLIAENSNESAINNLKKQKELLKIESNLIKRIEETARIANMTQALATFWENVANLFKKKINWEVLATMSLNDAILYNGKKVA